MSTILSYFMCLLLCTMKNILGFYSKEDNIDGESIILTYFAMPALVFLWDIMKISMGFDDGIAGVFGFLGCFAIVFLYVWGCCSLEYYIMEEREGKLQVFRDKGNGVMLLLSGCILLSGIAGGIDEYFGYWMIFLSYWIVSIVFVVTNIPGKSLWSALKRWKKKDGIFLLLMKLMAVGTSIYVKTLLFINLAQPNYGSIIPVKYRIKYEWLSDLDSVLFEMLFEGSKYVFVGLIPCLFVLYVVAALHRKNANKKRDVIWGIVVLAECFLSGFVGLVLWMATWM